MLSFGAFAAASLALIGACVANPWLPPWGSRKLLHMGTGTLLILFDPSDPLFAPAIYATTAAFVLLLSTAPVFSFATRNDKGIVSYLLLCSACAYSRTPFARMAPLFYADPLGAIVGRNAPLRPLYGGKSLGGTLAVFAAAWASLWAPRAALHAAALAAIELFSGKWDNPLIGLYLLALAQTAPP